MTRFVQIVTDRWRRNGMIAESDIEIYDYGLQLVLFTLLNLTVILTTAIIIGRFLESVLLLVTFIPIQAYGGGYHAKTHLRCFLTMYIGWWVVMFVVLPLICSIGATITSIIALIVIFYLAPVPHVNVGMSEEHRKKLRRDVRVSALLLLTISLIVVYAFADYSYIGITMALGLGISAFSMAVAHTKNLLTG